MGFSMEDPLSILFLLSRYLSTSRKASVTPLFFLALVVKCLMLGYTLSTSCLSTLLGRSFLHPTRQSVQFGTVSSRHRRQYSSSQKDFISLTLQTRRAASAPLKQSPSMERQASCPAVSQQTQRAFVFLRMEQSMAAVGMEESMQLSKIQRESSLVLPAVLIPTMMILQEGRMVESYSLKLDLFILITNIDGRRFDFTSKQKRNLEALRQLRRKLLGPPGRSQFG